MGGAEGSVSVKKWMFAGVRGSWLEIWRNGGEGLNNEDISNKQSQQLPRKERNCHFISLSLFSFHLFFLCGSNYLFFFNASILPFPTYTYPNNLVNIVYFFPTYSFANSMISQVADFESSVSCNFTSPQMKEPL